VLPLVGLHLCVVAGWLAPARVRLAESIILLFTV
jgi:hypothetical protein